MNGNYNGYDNRTPGGGNNYENRGYSFQTIMDIKSRNRGFAIASMVLGIFSVICCCSTIVALITATLSIIFAIVSRVRMGYFDGMAVAGLVLGIVGFVFAVSMLLLDAFFTEKFLEWLQIYYPDIYEQMMAEEPGISV